MKSATRHPLLLVRSVSANCYSELYWKENCILALVLCPARPCVVVIRDFCWWQSSRLMPTVRAMQPADQLFEERRQ